MCLPETNVNSKERAQALTHACEEPIYTITLSHMPMWSSEMERNWTISVTQRLSAEPCFLDLIEGNDPESGARLPRPQSRPPGATPPLTVAVAVAAQ